MKWLNRILGKEEEIPSTVAFAEIDTWLELVSKSLFRGLDTNASQLYDEIRDMRERLKQNIAELQDAESNEEVPDSIAKIGLLSRDKMVKHLYSMTEKVVVPTQTDYKTVLSFYSATTSNLEFPFGKSQKNIYCVRSLFPDEIKAVISDLTRLKKLLDQLIAPMKGKESQIAHLEQVPVIVRDIKELKLRIEKEKENVGNQKGDCSALERRIETEGSRLSKIEENEEWIRFKELENELSLLQEDLNALESNVRNLFSPLNKALELLKKQDETGRHTLTSEERRAIASILSSPIRALEEDINEYLLAIRNIIGRDPAILKDRKRETTLKWIDHLLNADLSSIRGKRERLQARIAEIKGKLSDLPILKDKEEIEQSIVSAEGQLTQLQEGIARSKRHIVSLEEELREKERLLVAALEGIAGKKIDVTFDL
ncbi:MAG: zinc ribbon domain-containing protein [Candidatus Methanospirareceae archaeon]